MERSCDIWHLAPVAGGATPRGSSTQNKMPLFRTDRLFAEAAQSPEHCNKLLKRIKRGRLGLFIAVIVFGGLVIAGICYEISQLGRFIDNIVNLKYGDKSPDGPKLSTFAPVTLSLLLPFIVEFIFLLYADACVKMILILQRQQQARPTNTSAQND